jgi:hypothetical protein
VITANIYTWRGSPGGGHRELIAFVSVRDVRAVSSEGFRLDDDILDPRTMTRILITDGERYVEALPRHYRNPPYLWCERVTTLSEQRDAWRNAS